MKKEHSINLTFFCSKFKLTAETQWRERLGPCRGSASLPASPGTDWYNLHTREEEEEAAAAHLVDVLFPVDLISVQYD